MRLRYSPRCGEDVAGHHLCGVLELLLSQEHLDLGAEIRSHQRNLQFCGAISITGGYLAVSQRGVLCDKGLRIPPTRGHRLPGCYRLGMRENCLS